MAIKIIVDPVKGLYQESTSEGASFNVLAGVTTTGISGGGGGASFFSETSLNSIATTGSVAMTYLSASVGATITGSFVQGEGNIASGIFSHAEGGLTNTSGEYSHAEGTNTVASNTGSHAEGLGAIASGIGSHAEGLLTIASGHLSHAEGIFTLAYGTGSFAAGIGTIAYGAVDGAPFPLSISQAVFGKYNIDLNTDSLFVIGDGFDVDNRRDVLRVNSGSVQVTGSFEVLGGITGSLSGTVGGNPFIVAGSNITTNYNALGQWEITGSGGSIPMNSWVDFMTQRNVAVSGFAGNYTVGFSFFTATSSSLVGYKLKWDGSLFPTTLNIKLWSAGFEVASVVQVVETAGTYTGSFLAPISLIPYKEYYLTYREDSGSSYYVIFGTQEVNNFAGPSPRSTRVRPDIIISVFYAYAGGDAQPNIVGAVDNCSILEPVISS